MASIWVASGKGNPDRDYLSTGDAPIIDKLHVGIKYINKLHLSTKANFPKETHFAIYFPISTHFFLILNADQVVVSKGRSLGTTDPGSVAADGAT